MTVLGIVYLLHFDRPYRHARHYTGWTEDLLGRLDEHAAGSGARLMTVVSRAGIGFVLARTCEGTRRTERAIKNAGGAVRYCPLCTLRPRNGRWGPPPADLVPRYYPACPQAGPRFILLPCLPPPLRTHPSGASPNGDQIAMFASDNLAPPPGPLRGAA